MINIIAQAQVQWSTVGIDGLTCSQCFYSVEQSIRSLSNVKDVAMNLNGSEAKVKQSIKSYNEILKIGEQVNKAGFSVRFLTITVKIDTSFNISTSKITNHIGSLLLLNNTMLNSDSLYTFQIIDSRFCKKNVYKQWGSSIKSHQLKNGKDPNNIFVIEVTVSKSH